MSKTKTSNIPSLFGGTAIVGGLTAFSRVLGFIRDLLIAQLFGASLAADMFFVAFRIPNTLRSFFAEGALSSAFIPVFAEELERNDQSANAFYRQALGVMLVITVVVVAVFFLTSETVVNIFAPGFSDDPQVTRQTAFLLQIMLPYLPSITFVVIINGVLTSLHRYGAGALAQIIVNLCLIGGVVVAGFAEGDGQAKTLALSVLFAALIQYALLFPLARASGFPPIPAFPRFSPAIRQMFILMVPALFGAAVYQLTILLNTVLASFLPTGSISWLFYADRISQLPIGVFTIALSSVLLPQLARGHARGDHADTRERLSAALRYSLFCLVPLSFLLSGASALIIQVLFERGEFTPEDTIQSARALRWFALGLIPLSLYSVISRHFIALKQTTIPAVIGTVTLISSFLLSMTLMGPLEQDSSSGVVSVLSLIQSLLPFRLSLEHEGLALSSALCACMSLSLSLIFLRRDDRPSVLSALSSGWKPIVASVLVYGVTMLPQVLAFTPLVQLLIVLALSPAAFIVTTFFLGSKELEETFSAFSRYISRRR
ncbi:MAG: murein biosynthesis integral membrane protein MurJ [Bdellovibrionales bacterium]|nr:murein biosynthesis integral membrane protein MurJ [Bdellovibrionales bacterium]